MILVGLLLLIGCSNKGADSDYIGTSTFPLTTDSRWVYQRNYYKTPYHDSSLADTESYSIIRHVIGPDTIIDGNQMIAVDDSIARSDSVDQTPYTTRHLYCITEGKLKEYGQITLFPWGEEVPVYYNPPYIQLDLPLITAKAWIGYQSVAGNAYSSVAGIEYIDVGDISIKCDVVRTRVVDPYTGHEYFDSFWWYSNDGLVRNEFDYGVEVIRDELGNPIDSVRSVEIMELLDMQIQRDGI